MFLKGADEVLGGFPCNERTEHKDILPANKRIQNYKTKNLFKKMQGKPPPSAAPGARTLGMRSMMSGAKSAATFNVMPGSAKEAALLRPTTAITGFVSDAPTAATGGMISAVSQNNLNAMNNRAISMSRFSKFEE